MTPLDINYLRFILKSCKLSKLLFLFMHFAKLNGVLPFLLHSTNDCFGYNYVIGVRNIAIPLRTSIKNN